MRQMSAPRIYIYYLQCIEVFAEHLRSGTQKHQFAMISADAGAIQFSARLLLESCVGHAGSKTHALLNHPLISGWRQAVAGWVLAYLMLIITLPSPLQARPVGRQRSATHGHGVNRSSPGPSLASPACGLSLHMEDTGHSASVEVLSVLCALVPSGQPQPWWPIERRRLKHTQTHNSLASPPDW